MDWASKGAGAAKTVMNATLAIQLGAALLVGVVAAALPAWRAAQVRIVDGLRAVV